MSANSCQLDESNELGRLTLPLSTLLTDSNNISGDFPLACRNIDEAIAPRVTLHLAFAEPIVSDEEMRCVTCLSFSNPDSK